MQRIGRYQIESELGKGAMGLVYKATDPTIGRPVALKTLRLDVHGIETEEMRKRFQNEARAAGVLNHPNIITIYDAGEDQGLFYIAMEFIPGETLAELLQKYRVLPPEQIIAILRGVCAGLDFAHSKSIVHRDIKPANIMIAPDGTAKIMDFGIAKASGNLTNTGQVLGTPNYMSPEQVRGRPLDGRTDLFSLGVVLYEMLTGEKPFAGQNVTTIIYKIVSENPVSPRELDPGIHPGLSSVVTRALSKDPNERYQTGAELAQELEKYKAAPEANSTLAGLTTSMTGSLTGSHTMFGTSTLAAVPATGQISQTTVAIATAPVAARVATPAPTPAPPAPTVASAERPRVEAPKAVVQHQPRPSRGKRYFVAAVAVMVLLALVAMGKKNQARKVAAAEPQRTQPSAQQVRTEQKPAPATVPQPKADMAAAKTAAAPVPTKPPEPVPTKGELVVTSDPAGSFVEIDGKTRDTWTTPFREKLEPGKHVVRVLRANYTPEKKTIEIIAGKKSSMAVTLAVALGSVHIASDPDGADILLNGQPTGKKTPADFVLPPGDQSFTLRKAGYDDSGDTVTVQTGQTVNITPKLSELSSPNNAFGKLGKFLRGPQNDDRGLLIVRTKPRGAHVAINGIVLPGVTPVRVPIRSGKFMLTVNMDGFQQVRREVVVGKGRETLFEEALSPQ